MLAEHFVSFNVILTCRKKIRGKPIIGKHRENCFLAYPLFKIYFYIYLIWEILLEKNLAKKNHFYLRQILGVRDGLDIVFEAKFLGRTSPLFL